MTWLIIGGVVLAVFLFSRKAVASTGGRTGGGTGGGQGEGAIVNPPFDPPAPVVGPVVPPPFTMPPGSTPQTAIIRQQCPKGFHGYLRVSLGDTLSNIAKAASELTGPAMAWRTIRDAPENDWAKAQTPTNLWETYGIQLNPNWGKTLGVDCQLTPGWKATNKNSYTGTYPVLRIG